MSDTSVEKHTSTEFIVTAKDEGLRTCVGKFTDHNRAADYKQMLDLIESCGGLAEAERNLAKGRALYKDMVDLQIYLTQELANILGKYEGTHQSNDEEPQDVKQTTVGDLNPEDRFIFDRPITLGDFIYGSEYVFSIPYVDKTINQGQTTRFIQDHKPQKTIHLCHKSTPCKRVEGGENET